MSEMTNADLVEALCAAERAVEAAAPTWDDFKLRIGAAADARIAVLARMVEPQPHGRTYRGHAWTDEQEAAAKKAYEGFKFLPGYMPWVEGGNSDKQNEARDLVRFPATPASS